MNYIILSETPQNDHWLVKIIIIFMKWRSIKTEQTQRDLFDLYGVNICHN